MDTRAGHDIITGGPRSGKTDKLINIVKENIQSGKIVLLTAYWKKDNDPIVEEFIRQTQEHGDQTITKCWLHLLDYFGIQRSIQDSEYLPLVLSSLAEAAAAKYPDTEVVLAVVHGTIEDMTGQHSRFRPMFTLSSSSTQDGWRNL